MEIASRMMRLFEGFATAYGTYDPRAEERNAAKGGKLEIKSTASTVRARVSIDLWRAHINGVKPLGVIPIREDDMCLWGCIDIDKYDVSHGELVQKIEKMKLPLVVCRSKSGGAHVFLFMNEPIPAGEIQDKLREMAASLGHGGSEIFPKQTKVLVDRGDLGNWLNMPYFDGNKTTRYCIKKTMAGMTVEEFCDFAEGRRVSRNELAGAKAPKTDDQTMEDGPPCLQYLAGSGFPEGSRNNGLFALGVFCKKKFGPHWKEVLEKYNHDYMVPPLPADEVAATIKNLDKKEYNYPCKQSPIVNHCNSVLCRTRLYGVGGGDEFPVISGLSVLATEPPLWFVDIEGQRIDLTTDQLQNYRLFQKLCMERLFVCYQLLKQDTWVKMVGIAMREAVKIEAPIEVSTRGHFLEILEVFCTDRHKAQNKEEILLGKPWEDEDTKRYYFRLSDLMLHLERAKFLAYGRNKVSDIIREIGGKDFFNHKGKGMNVMWVPASVFIPTPSIDPPPVDTIPI